MTNHDFEKALAALKALTHNDDETPMMIDMACWLIDHLDEVTAALQAAIEQPVQNETGRDALQQPAQGWMPIETAPKDGNTFLAWNKNYIHGIGVTYWSDVYEKCMVGFLDQPTHWMPLPAAPDVSEVG